MAREKSEFQKDVAFINREKEFYYLKKYINERPESMLFVHGPKSSGKTTLLYRFLEKISKDQKLEVKYLNLRKILVSSYKDFIRIFFGLDFTKSRSDLKEKREYNLFNLFKLSVEALKGVEAGALDPFKLMEGEFIQLNKKGIKPILVIDELQELNHIYLNGGKDRHLIIELFNFFVAMTKESHLAHIIIASSDGYFIDTVFCDSRLKKTSKFLKVDYLDQESIVDWLLNLRKYSKIEDYTLTREDAEKIWDVMGGSAWEVQELLSDLFDLPIDEALSDYKQKVQAMIAHYCEFDNKKTEVLKVIKKKRQAKASDFLNTGLEAKELKAILKDMVRNNILYFDPVNATYTPQGASYVHGISLFLDDQPSL
jgi:AAA+ ATPase superfamily predicted ATPase